MRRKSWRMRIPKTKTAMAFQGVQTGFEAKRTATPDLDGSDGKQSRRRLPIRTRSPCRTISALVIRSIRRYGGIVLSPRPAADKHHMAAANDTAAWKSPPKSHGI